MDSRLQNASSSTPRRPLSCTSPWGALDRVSDKKKNNCFSTFVTHLASSAHAVNNSSY